MRIYAIVVVLIFVTLSLLCINARLDNKDENDSTQNDITSTAILSKNNENVNLTIQRSNSTAYVKKSGLAHLYEVITQPIFKFFRSDKVSSVIRNVGVCAVNGFMELISFYLPAPMIPLIATVAGLVIPFEPIIMLKHKMPVTSYRRAFQTAVNGFIKTFDKYKVDADYDDDPYMTRRFNRRFMNAPNTADKVENVK